MGEKDKIIPSRKDKIIPSMDLIEPKEKSEDTENTKSSLEISMDQLFSYERLEMKSDLSQELILAMARGNVIAEKFRSPELKELMNNILKFSVSKDRKGRIEMVDLARNMQEPLEDTGGYDVMRRMFGGS